MENLYLGKLDHGDPLYEILLSRVFPDIRDPLFHVDRTSSQGVYKYTEEKSSISIIGKFFNPADTRYDRIQRIKGEYDNLHRIRGYGFDTFPHYVVRPIGREEKIGLALIEEYIDGKDLDHYMRKAIYQGETGRLKEKLSKLATFLCKLHTKTAEETRVDLGQVAAYFRKVVDKLCRQEVAAGDDRRALFSLMDRWLERDLFRKAGTVILHGDATPTNFIFTGSGGVVAIDLERMKSGDMVYDVGMVSGELKHAFLWRTGNPFGAEPFIRHFLKRYSDHFRDSRKVFRRITARVPFYMAMTELRIARNHYLDRSYRKRLVYEARECLRCGLRSD